MHPCQIFVELRLELINLKSSMGKKTINRAEIKQTKTPSTEATKKKKPPFSGFTRSPKSSCSHKNSLNLYAQFNTMEKLKD